MATDVGEGAGTDDRLWVRLKPGWSPESEQRWRIDGNAHTHRGHFHVCAIGLDLHRSVNLGDVAEVSPEARIWLDGFLCGQEAGQFEFMGRSDELLDGMDAGDEARWRAWNKRFRATGIAAALPTLPAEAAELDGLDEPQPWTYIAGRYWVWSCGRWAAAEHQPAPELDPPGWAWPGTTCAARRHHALSLLGPVTVCDDCHEVTG